MSTLTGTQIVSSAYRKNAVTSPSSTELTDGLQDLNTLLGSWSAEGLLIPSISWENFSLVAGTQNYTIGTGATFDTTRPTRIIDAYLQDSSGDRSELDVHMTVQEYNRWLGTIQARPNHLHYLPSYPNGKIYFENPPDAAYTLYINSEKPLTEVTLNGAVSLPEEYRMALIYNLAVLLSHDIDNKLADDVFEMAFSTKRTLANKNIVVNPARIDSALLQDGSYDINNG